MHLKDTGFGFSWHRLICDYDDHFFIGFQFRGSKTTVDSSDCHFIGDWVRFIGDGFRPDGSFLGEGAFDTPFADENERDRMVLFSANLCDGWTVCGMYSA